MERYYRFAGVEVQIRIPDAFAGPEEGHLAPFAVPSVSSPCLFEFEPAQTLPAPEGICIAREPNLQVWASGDIRQLYWGTAAHPYLHACRQGRQHRVRWCPAIHPGPIGSRTILEAMNAAHLVNQAGGCILHCSYIEYRGRAILFTAPSGVGKSTQAELWRSHRGARIINGDRAAVGIAEGIAMAQAIPFAGSSQYCLNRDLPLAAIVYLGQAEQTRLQPLTGVRAFRSIWEGCTVNIWDPEDVDRATQTVTELLRRVPVYRLDCLPDESAVAALEQCLKEVTL